MKKLFLILMSFLCLSHQAFTIYNPFQVLLLIPGRAAAVVAYAGNKVGLVSEEASRAITWLHEDDSLRSTWFYEELIANIHRKASSFPTRKQKQLSVVKSDTLRSDFKIKLEKIATLRDQLESFLKNIGHDNHQPNVKKSPLHINIEAIRATLDIASKNITEFQELQNIDFVYELFSESLENQDFMVWFNTQKSNADLLSKIQQERHKTLADIPSFVIEDTTLQSLEDRITGLIQAPKLNFSAHVSLAKQHHKKEANQYLSAAGTYAIDLCACKNAEDYITIGAGGLGLLGFMSLMSKNNSEISKIAYIGCGGATSLVAKKLYYQFLYEHEENISLDILKTNLYLTESRLANLRRYIYDNLFRMRSQLKNEFDDSIRDARSTRIEQGVDKLQYGVARLESGQAALQLTVADGFKRVEKWQQQQSSKTGHLQQSMNQLKGQIDSLDEQFCTWANTESNARNKFEAHFLQKLSLLDEVVENSRKQLYLTQKAASQDTI